MIAAIAISTLGVVAPASAGSELPGYQLPGGDDNLLYLSWNGPQPPPVMPGGSIGLDAPIGVDFSNASVAVSDSDPQSTPRVMPALVGNGGRHIEWSVPGDVPPGSRLGFKLTGVKAPGYGAWTFDDTFEGEAAVKADGSPFISYYLGMSGEFYGATPVTFPSRGSVKWALPSSSRALEQLEAGLQTQARFGELSGVYIPEGDSGEDIPVVIDADQQSMLGSLSSREESFALVIYAQEKLPSPLHSLVFVYEDVTTFEPYDPVVPTCEPSDQVIGAIRERYEALDGPCGFLGEALTDELATPVKFGRFNHFEGGSIYWSPATGAWEVHGAIRDTWSQLGWENGAVGFPVSDELPTPTKPGAFNHFQAGSIYWSPSTGAREVRGAIRDTWSRLGWENGAVGFPVTNETPTPSKFGAFNHFQSGSIYWSPSTGAREVRGAIRDAWSRQGWENGALGFPISDEYAIPGGRRSDFLGGSITWTPAGGTVVTTR